MKLSRLRDRLVDRAFWALITAVLLLVVAVFAVLTNTPVDGYRKTGSWQKGLVVSEPLIPEASGLVAGDKIISIDGEAVAGRRLPAPGRLVNELSQRRSSALYEVERNGRLLTVVVPLRYIGWDRLVVLGGVHFFLPAFFAILAAVLYLRSGTSQGDASLLAVRSVRVICFALAFAGTNVISVVDLSVRLYPEWLRLLGLAVPVSFGLIFGLLLHFFLIFPSRDKPKRWPLVAVHGSHLSVSSAATLYAILGRVEPWPVQRGRFVLAAVFIVLSVVLAFKTYRRTASPVQRNQMKWLAWGTAVGIGPWFFFYLLFITAGLPPLIDYRLVILWTAVIPISLLVAITRYRLLEIDGLVRSSLVYTVLMAAMTGLYLTAVGAGSWFLQARWSQTNPVAVAIVTVVLLALAFNPLKVLSERLVAKTFYQGVTDPREAASRLASATSRVIQLPDLARVLTAEVPRAFAASGAALIVIEDSGSRVFANSEQRKQQVEAEASQLIGEVQARSGWWPDVLYPAVGDRGASLQLPGWVALCLPLQVAGRLLGLYLLGEKLSGSLYRGDEIDTLRTLAHHAATALDNACAYQRLNQLNAELERIVELRTEQLQLVNAELAAKNDELLAQNAQLERLIGQLRETQVALLEAERRAAIGEIVITVCHEINNPLSAIIGQAQLIQMRPEGVPERVMEKVRAIDSCAEKIREITEKMRKLDGTKTVSYVGQVKMIDLNQEPEPKKEDALKGKTGSASHAV